MVVAFAVLQTRCAPTQQALLSSGGSADFAAMKSVTEDFGQGEPDKIVSISIDGQEKPFKVWLSKSKPKIMVQNGLNSEIAGAAFTRGLTGGIANSQLPPTEPYRQAALDYLQDQRPGCSMSGFYPVARIGYVWEYACDAYPSKPERRKGG